MSSAETDAQLARRDVATARAPLPIGRAIVWIVVLLLAARVVWAIAVNKNFEWPVVGEWLNEASILHGLSVSLGLTVVAMVLGVVVGLLLAVARLSSSRLLAGLAGLYIWFFRGTPLLVQLIFWYNMSTLFPAIVLSAPFGPEIARWKTNDVITPLTAAIAGLALNEAAYMAEIIRAGLLSVDTKQAETAEAFGMTRARALRRIVVQPGTTTAILGPSGSGKSTFLRCINHLEEMDAGVITIGAMQVGYELRGDTLRKLSPAAIARQRRHIGMVFQQFNLYPHLTVLQNITEAPIGVHGRKRAEAEAEAHDLLARIGLREKANEYPRQLSGGQQQRVAIARALAIKPQLLLFDEPTSALDPELVGEVLLTMRDLAKAGLTMIVVTHEIEFAREVADQVVFVDGGVIVEQGPPEQVVSAPQHPRTRAFLSRFR